MAHIYRRKLIGTAIFTVAVLGVTLASYSVVQARLLATGRTIITDGTVTAASPSSITVQTNGGPVTFDVNNRTHFSRFSGTGIVAGDHVRITGRQGAGNPVARVVRNQKTNYGTAGDNAWVTDGIVAAKTANTITVDVKGEMFTFEILSSTRFTRTTFTTLQVGDKVSVNGEDNGTNFFAQRITKKS